MPWHRPVVHRADGDAVVLLHGLWRSKWAMTPMARFLHQQGYHTINIPYPSFRKPLDELADHVIAAIKQHSGNRRIHFVTHSLGGIVTRSLLEKAKNLDTGRVVMLAPPNQGSEIIDWMGRCPPLRSTLGPAGKFLSTALIDAPPAPDNTDTAVIMGKRALIPFFRNFLDQDNDGIVSAASGKVEGMNEFHILDIDHTFIATDPQIMDMTLRFLREGKALK